MLNDLNINGTIYKNVSKLKAQKAGTANFVDLIDTSDATATANDVRNGKKVYVNGQGVIGTWEPVVPISPQAQGDIYLSDNQFYAENIITFFDAYAQIYRTINTLDPSQFPLTELPACQSGLEEYNLAWDKTLEQVNAMTTGGFVRTVVTCKSTTPTTIYPTDDGFLDQTYYTNYMYFYFQRVDGAFELDIDWGDGTTHSTVSCSATTQYKNISHQFMTRSKNPIIITLTSGTSYALGAYTSTTTTTGYSFFGVNANSSYLDFGKTGFIKEIRVGYGAKVGATRNNDTYYINSFYYAASVENYILPEGCFYNNTNAGGGAFYSNNKLKGLSLPSGITKWNYTYKASNMNILILPESCTELTLPTGNYTMLGKLIYLPDTLTTFGSDASPNYPGSLFNDLRFVAPRDLISLAFRSSGGFNYKKLDLSRCVQLQTLKVYNWNVEEIDVPETVTTLHIVGTQDYGMNLRKVILHSTTPPAVSLPTYGGYTSISTSYSQYVPITYYVPNEALEAYRNATNWSQVAPNIVGY